MDVVNRAARAGVYAFVVLGGLLCGRAGAEMIPGPLPPMAVAEQDPLSVMTVNLWRKDRPAELKIMAEHLRSDLPEVPDFILCQEVMFRRGGPHRNTAEVLAHELGYHARGTKRTSDREGVAIVSRYPFIHYAERHLKHQTSRLLIGFRRVSVMGEFMVPGVGRVRVVNVHFTNWGFESRIRGRQLAETLEWIEQRQQEAPAALTFLGGDFNARIDQREMDQLRSKRRSMVFQDFNSLEPSKGSPGNPDKRIDFIFVSAPQHPLKLIDEQLMWKNGLPRGRSRFHLSDHLPVVHLYQFDQPAGQSVTSVAE
jgi:endonuclease/exonuclease/phosphatase family metal-dependent hydrolase